MCFYLIKTINHLDVLKKKRVSQQCYTWKNSTLSTRWRTDIQEPVQGDIAATAASLHDVCHNVTLHVRALSCSWEMTPRQNYDASESNKPLFKAVCNFKAAKAGEQRQ